MEVEVPDYALFKLYCVKGVYSFNNMKFTFKGSGANTYTSKKTAEGF